MAVSRRIIRIGHSYGLILPRALLQALGWTPGQRLRVEVRDRGLFILPEPAVPEAPPTGPRPADFVGDPMERGPDRDVVDLLGVDPPEVRS